MSRTIHEKILVYINFDTNTDFIVEHGIEIALFSKKELVLLHVINTKKGISDNNLLEKVQLQMKNLVNVTSQVGPINVTGYVLEENKFQLINSIANRLGVAIVFYPINKYQTIEKTTLQLISSSRIPYILVKNKMTDRGYKNVVFPIDPSVEVKEKVLWAVFFSIHYNSIIHIVYAKKPDKIINTELQKNIFYTRKTFENFEVNYRIHELEGSSWDIHKLSTGFAEQNNFGLSIIMMTKHYGLFDYLLGPHEQKFINCNKNIPVMCINSRDDLYIPCI